MGTGAGLEGVPHHLQTQLRALMPTQWGKRVFRAIGEATDVGAGALS